MKYFLLILGVLIAFSPSGVCMDVHCCVGDQVIEIENKDDCGQSSCCDHNEDQQTTDHKEESNSQKIPQHSQSQHCDCCATTFVLNLPIIVDESNDSYSPEINTKAEKLLTRYSFSIWNPPINVV